MSVSVLPIPSALGGFGPSSSLNSSSSGELPDSCCGGQLHQSNLPGRSAMQNGSPKSFDDMTVAQIKDKAKLQAQKVTRSASALSLIGVARTQILQARTSENQGDLKSAYSSYIKAVSLLQTFMDSAEFKAETQPGKRGALFKEHHDFQQVRINLFAYYF
jgi:hypothetical protein